MNLIKLALVIGLMVSGSVYATGFNNGGFSDYPSSQNIYSGLSFINQKGGVSRLFDFYVSIKYSLVKLKTYTDNFRCGSTPNSTRAFLVSVAKIIIYTLSAFEL